MGFGNNQEILVHLVLKPRQRQRLERTADFNPAVAQVIDLFWTWPAAIRKPTSKDCGQD